MTPRPLVRLVRHLRGASSLPKALTLLAATAASYALSFVLRFDLRLPAEHWPIIHATLPLLLAARGCASWYWGLHLSWWRFVSLPDLCRILKSIAAGSVAFGLLLVVLGLDGVPRSILIIEPVLTFVTMAALMVISRQLHPGRASVSRGTGKRVLIVGAGETGNHAARELRHHPGLLHKPIGFVDDSPHKQGALIQDAPVLGTIADIPRIAADYAVQEIVIAMPSADRRRIREVMEICQRTSARVRILPATTDLIQGRVTVTRLREVRIEDLLGRPAAAFDLESVRPLLQDAAVCVTGAGGSIGSELCRQITACRPRTLVMIDRNENNLHYLHNELRERFPDVELRSPVVDITDPRRVDHLLATTRPRIVFHAAAYKHVPLMEDNPCEAVKNNIIGTRFVAQAADSYGVERFVMISTDKAINPTSIMGSTKRIAELLLQGLQDDARTRYTAVRFGNVLGSDGSVVPLFKRQIARGGPVTVTHPNVVRFFMLVDEAVHLVLHAGLRGEGGEIFLLNMGQPVRIIDLARDMIRLSGLEPYVDIDIRITGLRPGEKLYEELCTPSEIMASTSHPEILRLVEPEERDFTSSMSAVAELERLALAGDSDAVREMIQTILPEYRAWPSGRIENGADTSPPLDLPIRAKTSDHGSRNGVGPEPASEPSVAPGRSHRDRPAGVRAG